MRLIGRYPQWGGEAWRLCGRTGMVESGQAVHRTIVVVDVEGFGDPRRTLPHQVGTRAGLYRVVADSLRAAGVPWDGCYHEDRGDSVFVLVPPEYPKAPLVEVLPEALARALREHNDTSPAAQRTRLRVAVHAGEVAFDGHGVTSTAVTTAFRLLDAPTVKQALADSPGLVALVVSRWTFDEVVRHCAVLDPATFRPVSVQVKEVRDTAWVALPDHPYPADPGVLDQPAPDDRRDDRRDAPRQLPAPPAHFVGRAEYLADLDRALTTADGTAVVISALGGTGGIGKTWLALHWAHRHADRFPDGHLFVDLRGFSPDSLPLDPAVAVRGFLDALGVAPGRLPVDPDAQAALYRSLVADRRMLVVLDNAATADQVVPLLPGSPACAVLVTGRTTLAALIDRYGARHLQLDILPRREARALLTERLGEARVAAEHAAIDDLVELCGRYPLALSITARHAATHPLVPLAEFAAELRDLGLDALDNDDPTASLPAVLSWSLRGLTTDQRQVFALLGTAPGPDTGLPAAASLTGLPEARARQALRALEDASLLDRRPHGRYRMHDLVRAYAATTAQDLAEPVRRAASERVAGFYLHTARAADLLLDPQRPQIEFDPPAAHCRPQGFQDEEEARAWFTTEHLCLLAAQTQAVEQGRHDTVWRMAWVLDTFHRRLGHLHDNLAVWRAGLAATRQVGDLATRARAHRFLGRALSRLGQHTEALEHLHQDLVLGERAGDIAGQAYAHRALAWAQEQRGDLQQALDHVTAGLRLFRAAGLHGSEEASALGSMGWLQAQLGDYTTARTHCAAALDLHRRSHDQEGEAVTQDSLGYIAHQVGHYADALDHYDKALALFHDLGYTYYEAQTREHLGHTRHALDQPGQARAVWLKALELYRRQGRDADAQRVRQELDGLVDITGRA
ncbi:ATP-binding protein [Actinosynnema sp. CS-041913]|uniref:ATP-binding protein n=1 Tax=Actinosynnema sp. CS-041913 TaxID=3239917 RepID=UPI003D949415